MNKQQILKEISDLEKSNKIKILFLLESGSRAWGFESDDSDYDIRGVFIQDYLKVDGIMENISAKIGNLDIELWDLRKFLRLMTKSNPSTWEWLSSKIVYFDSDLRKELIKLFVKSYDRESLWKHYVSMAKQNFNKYIVSVREDGDKVSLKKYIYVLRSLSCALWIEKHSSPPPKHYNETINLFPKEVMDFFIKVVKAKKKSESLTGNRNMNIENYVVKFFDRPFKRTNRKSFDMGDINKIFKGEIKKWK